MLSIEDFLICTSIPIANDYLMAKYLTINGWVLTAGWSCSMDEKNYNNSISLACSSPH